MQWAVVTSNLFDVLSITPALGRLFHVEEDRPGTTPAAVISYALWQRRFGSAPDVVHTERRGSIRWWHSGQNEPQTC